MDKQAFLGNAGTNKTGHYIKLEDGKPVTLRIKVGTTMSSVEMVFDGGRSRLATDQDDPSEITTKYALSVITSDGKDSKLEGSNNLFKRFRKIVEGLDGDVYDYQYEVERMGAPGAKDTVYVWRVLGKVPAVATAKPAGASPAALTAARKVATAKNAAELAAKPDEELTDEELLAKYPEAAIS